MELFADVLLAGILILLIAAGKSMFEKDQQNIEDAKKTLKQNRSFIEKIEAYVKGVHQKRKP